jgi:hypothetical protein
MTAPLRSLFRIQALCCAALWTVAGCDGSSTAARTDAQTGPAGASSAIAARTADSDVELAEVEAPIAMRLYDLEREQYALLRVQFIWVWRNEFFIDREEVERCLS